ncbi:hypothetical protein IC789_14225 [Acinetobacter seifertii]|uniref:Uncharacterized protein n=1 Tax=Acinetobacter seifertii TaxID=1530123 RepID=A0A7H2T2U9_9GAMM|nr:hypothetical protein [Acinetobacter seifertii]QNX13198.1 hypothetical protein IC794_05305 [Acinetobacter seifertii]QNX18769.1 hypothetical protein IC792_13995 [Acinetobacter seifertii]QNX36401.1 hypothetical protein IC789_14225 [Acinetobacter seifertii]QNX40220.1 hypothetical protein IC787_14115 [Acinetobacter seifertii]QNX46121.1 hypothetical protein IC785_05465 [Acinetobacter seifertii]
MSKTVKIKPSHESQGEFVIISVDQFNPSEHELIEGESLPVDDNEVPNGALVPVEQFDELANKLIISEEQLLKAKEELMAFKNDVPAMQARIAELQADDTPVGATNENQNPSTENTGDAQASGSKAPAKNSKQSKDQE